MKHKGPKGAAAIDKSMGLLVAVLRGDGASLAEQAREAGIAPSTAQRMVAALMRQGMLSRIGRGRYAAGFELAALAGGIDTRGVLARVSRPLIRELARTLGTAVHLGVLEGEMVTYVVKEQGGGGALLTREAEQFEAYCSGIGKVLLAALDEGTRDQYLAAGPFVRMTPNTITDPADLRTALRNVAELGHAADRAEFDDGLYCLAVPVTGPKDQVVAAVSSSSRTDHCSDPDLLRQLTACARRIGARLGAE